MLLILLLLLFIMYFFYKYNKQKAIEQFKMLNGITKPMVTSDDYATQYYMFDFNNLPFYDSKYKDIDNLEPIDKADYCNMNNTLVSRCIKKKLIPNNYVDYEKIMPVTLTSNTLDKSFTAPLPQNYYY